MRSKMFFSTLMGVMVVFVMVYGPQHCALAAEAKVPFAQIDPVEPKAFTIPAIDISEETERQVVVDKDPKRYFGHPSTLLMPDGKTMYGAWSLNHGGPPLFYKMSLDGGLTWSEHLPAPAGSEKLVNCPFLHRLKGPDGTWRLFSFVGGGDAKANATWQSHSVDGGKTWTAMRNNGMESVVAPPTIVPVDGGSKYLCWYHTYPAGAKRSSRLLEVRQSASTDGGLTWGETRVVCRVKDAAPCEPGVVRSPDGKQLLMLMRENARRLNSLMMTSDDEGRTWSAPRELPAALTGDRHQPRYAPDGRLVMTFRDMAAESPTRGHFVAWVGTYDDIVSGREGQYRVKLLHQYGRSGDCGYSGLELLPDGTLAATTYVQHKPDEKNSIVSVRFKLDEIDAIHASGQAWRTAAGHPAEGEIGPFLGQPKLEMQQVFQGERFPNIVVAVDGTLLATWGSASVRARRSEDGGKTWGEEITIAKPGFQSGGLTVDEKSGDIIAFAEAHHPPAPVNIFRSADHGKTWQAQTTVIKPDSKGNLPSMHMNEHGITLRHGAHKGRLLRPSRWYAGKNDSSLWPKHYTNAIYSDDGGRSWQTSEPFPAMGTGEATVAELSDGRIYYNSRRHWAEEGANPRRRWTAWSADGGATWEDLKICEILPDGPQDSNYGCMGGLVRLPIEGRDILVYSNCDSPAGRHHGTVWASFDGGKTWPVKRLVYEGAFAYSSITAGRPKTKTEGEIYLHFEGGPKGGSTVATFNLSWLLGGEKTGDGEVPDLGVAQGVQITELDDRVRVEIDGKLFTEYRFKDVPRPFFYPVIGPEGDAMTRNWPMAEGKDEEQDHVHHRSWWFTHGAVNGHDFWGETAKCGNVIHDRFLEISSGPESGVIRSRNKWVAKDGTLICTDTRTHTFHKRPDGAVPTDWEVQFHASEGKLVLGDTKEGSMAIRVAPTLRLEGKVAQGMIVNSEGLRGKAAWGKRAAWCDYYGPVNGKVVGVATFDHPGNLRHPTWWMARHYGLCTANPFGKHVFEGTPPGSGDVTIPAGQDLTFRWRFYFHRGDTEAAKVAEQYEEYARKQE